MNEYEAKIPSLIMAALEEGATVPELESILGEKAQKYLYDSGIVSMPTTQSALGGIGGLGGYGFKDMADYSLGQSDDSPPGAGFMDKLGMGESKDMTGYGQAKDMSQYANIPKLLAMSNQMKRGQQQRAPTQGYMHPMIRSLLGD